MRAALALVLARVKVDYPFRGAFLAGSYARGEPATTSDVDVFIIIDGAWRQRCIQHVGGYEFELFFNPAARLREELQAAVETGDSATLQILLDAEILEDPHGEITDLKDTAEAMAAGGPPAWSGLQRELARYAVTDLLKDVEDLAHQNSEIARRYLWGLALDRITEAWFGLRRQWIPKQKYRLDRMLAHDRALAPLLAEIEHGGIGGLYALARVALEPAGGLIEGDWWLERQQLDGGA